MSENTGIPSLFELYCRNCSTVGGMDQEYVMEFKPISGSDDDDDNDDDDDDDDDDGDKNDDGEEHDDHHIGRRDYDWDRKADFGKMFKDHLKRNVITYTVTQEIKIRKQLSVKTSGGAGFVL